MKGLNMSPSFTSLILPLALSPSTTLASVASSFRSPITTTFVAGLAAITESTMCFTWLAAARRLGSEASLPPSREGQWLTRKKNGSFSIVPHIVTKSRVLKFGISGILNGIAALPSSLKTSGR